MNRKKLADKIASAIFGIVFALAVLEIIFYFNPELLPPNVRFSAATNFDTEMRQFFKPDVNIKMELPDGDVFSIKTIKIEDDIGFRDDGINHDQIYAAAIGDSFVYGHGLEMEDTWVELLEKEVDRDVINAGMPNAYPETELIIFRKYVKAFNPKIVILGISQNDFVDAYVFNYLEKNFGYTYLKRKLDSTSSVYRLFRFAVTSKWFGEYKSYPHFTAGNITYIIDPFLAGPAVDGNNKEILNGKKRNMDSILELKKSAEESGSEFLLVIFPTKEQVFWDKVKQVTNGTYNIDFLSDELSKFAEENDIKYIDMTEKFREISKTEPDLFFHIDGHMNQKGNIIVKDLIYNYLDEKNLLK